MEIKGRLGKTITVHGEISAEEDIRIDGRVEGKIQVTKNLVIGEGGEIKAEVKARKVTLDGSLRGDITATDRVEIGRSASFEGNLTSPRLAIADGAYFRGNVDMTGQSHGVKPPAAPDNKL